MTSVAALPADLAELFGGELAPTVRRMGERPIGGGPVADEQAGARAAVWETLTEPECSTRRPTAPEHRHLLRWAS